MSLAHRIKQLESLRALPEDAAGRAQAILKVEQEISDLMKEAGVPEGTKIRETPKTKTVKGKKK